MYKTSPNRRLPLRLRGDHSLTQRCVVGGRVECGLRSVQGGLRAGWNEDGVRVALGVMMDE